ncbi:MULTISPECIES: amidase family protein [unclassified Rhodococcus (in: high G+C Gram-positive bacteria)]|uniref:amidase n=1 Tax=Rhodococcus sp. SJ-3 TaxID=3454628 RepID=UPI003F78E472
MSSALSRRRMLGSLAGGALLLGTATAQRSHAGPVRRLPDPGAVDATDPALLSAVEAASLLHSGRLHPRELLDACLARTRGFDGAIGAWVRLYPEFAYAGADAAGERLTRARSEGIPVPDICGLPVALKDLFAVSGFPLTASSRVLEGNIAAGHSGVWSKLEDAGAILMGHAHTDEFAIGIATPQVGNPWNTEMSPGGSSGGSAAVLAARFAPLAVGSDTGGSVRLPASACGISSIKPTYGRITSHGMIPLTWTRDHVGPMGRSVADASLMLSILATVDVDDPITALGPAVPAGGYPLTAKGGASPLAGIRLGLPPSDLPPPLQTLFDDAVQLARSLGAEVVPVVMPPTPTSLATGDVVEMGSYHRQFADRIGLYRPERVSSVGTAVASLAVPVVDYLMLERDRLRYQYDYNKLFADNDLDAVMIPGTKVDGARREEFLGVSVTEGAPGEVKWANYSGAPVVTLPVGRSVATGMPFGVQLGARPWQDEQIIQIGLELQETLPVWRDLPALVPAPGVAPEVVQVAPGPGPDPTNTVDAAAPLRTPPMNAIG